MPVLRKPNWKTTAIIFCRQIRAFEAVSIVKFQIGIRPRNQSEPRFGDQNRVGTFLGSHKPDITQNAVKIEVHILTALIVSAFIEVTIATFLAGHVLSCLVSSEWVFDKWTRTKLRKKMSKFVLVED